MVRLADLKIRECDGCHSCWKGRPCVKDDDMNGIYDKIAASDVIVFGTPVYWFGPTGLMKLFLDRFVYFNCPENQAMVQGKKAILAVPFEDTDLETARPLVDMFRKSMDYLKMDLVDVLLVPGVTRKGEIKNRKEDLEKGFVIGTCFSR
jgi:multimeric flavodoxin WrbA